MLSPNIFPNVVNCIFKLATMYDAFEWEREKKKKEKNIKMNKNSKIQLCLFFFFFFYFFLSLLSLFISPLASLADKPNVWVDLCANDNTVVALVMSKFSWYLMERERLLGGAHAVWHFGKTRIDVRTLVATGYR